MSRRVNMWTGAYSSTIKNLGTSLEPGTFNKFKAAYLESSARQRLYAIFQLQYLIERLKEIILLSIMLLHAFITQDESLN